MIKESKYQAIIEKQAKEIDKLKMVINKTPVAIVMSEGHAENFSFTNESYSKLFGYTDEEVHNAHTWWLKAYPNEEYRSKIVAEWEQKISQAIHQKNGIAPIETLVTCKDGSQKNIRWGFISTDIQNWSFGIDLTELRQAEKALLIAKEKLEADALELQELNATKDRLINLLAHDLKSPFNGLLGISELLLENVDSYQPDEIKMLVGHLHSVSKNTFNLLNDLLEWISAHKNSITFNPKKTYFDALVWEVVPLIKDSARQKDIKLHVDMQSGVSVHIDRDMIKTVLRNLLSNAIKFTHSGGEIQLNAIKEKNHLLIEVIDDGIGMDAETVSNLFRVDQIKSNTGTAGEIGTGFGLLLCQEFVSKHNGTISVQSSLGNGSKFTIDIPSD